MRYRLIDHTADFGIQVFGSDLPELFSNAAVSMFDLITDVELLEGFESCELHVKGDDLPDLMVNWLREVLYLWIGNEFLVHKTTDLRLSENSLSGKVFYDRFNPERHQLKSEIKAVTYHQIQVNKVPSGWESQIIFDV